MIEETEYLQVVSETKADVSPFLDIAINQEGFREILVKYLLDTSSINVYYHSYVILKEVTKTNPMLFYAYWEQFASLLRYDNSYHRNYGMEMIANVVAVDKKNRFELIMDDYYLQLDDEKISTIKHCISNSASIIKEKPNLAKTIILKIIDALRVNDHTERHQNFLLAEFLKLLIGVNNDLIDNYEVNGFLNDVLVNTKSEKIKRQIKKYIAQQ